MNDNRILQAVTGITCTQETDLQAAGNILQSCLAAGMGLFVRGGTALTDNRVRNCGYAPAIALGIAVYAEEILAPSGAHARIQNNEVIDTGISADGTQLTAANAVGIAGWLTACQITGNRIGYSQALPVSIRSTNTAPWYCWGRSASASPPARR